MQYITVKNHGRNTDQRLKTTGEGHKEERVDAMEKVI